MDLEERGDDLDVFTLSYIKDGSTMVFTRCAKKLEAGKPYFVVMHKGELELLANSPLIQLVNSSTRQLVNFPDEGVRVYDWADKTTPLGWWRGTLTKIESADAADVMAHALQSVGDFRRIRPDTPWAWWGAFRSMYCPDELPSTNLLTIDKGTLGGLGTTAFSSIIFEGDADISEATGIRETATTPNAPTRQYYDLSGRKMSNSNLSKGVYIKDGVKVVINN